ncbi:MULTISPECIES: DUF1049 domain-containing protein [unclassified Pseudomonas]|uniref:DUF1049 domain-containing protein n=1 Tax=unclassified Pseudomonas TaxID=196821 RepID=UPI0035BED5B6
MRKLKDFLVICFLVVLAILVGVFALENHHSVTLVFFGQALGDAPVSLIALGGVSFGVLLGWGLASLHFMAIRIRRSSAG